MLAASRIDTRKARWNDGGLATTSAVDVALVLSVDCSSSMDDGDYRLQMNGIAAALADPAVVVAATSGPERRIGIALVQWSTRVSQVLSLPWTILEEPADFLAAAAAVAAIPRTARPGGTGLAAGLAYARVVLAAAPFFASRRVIDVSGDGDDNEGGDVPAERDRAIATGTTINGLPIVEGSKLIVAYYRDDVIGGPGAFLIPTDNSFTFPKAFRQKLLQEVSRPVV
jgi:hypothetical protein